MTDLPPRKKPIILAKRPISASRLYSIEELDLRFSNNVERQYFRIKSKAQASVMIAPVLDNETFLLIREYNAGIDQYSLTFPKGAVDSGETVLQAANRELMEEVGYASKKLELIKVFSTSPSYMTARMHFVLAKDLHEKSLLGDEPEPIDVIPWRFSDVDELLARDDFHEARSIAALLWLAREYS